MAGGRHIPPSHQFAWVLKREPPDREFRNRRSDLDKKEANICNISSGRNWRNLYIGACCPRDEYQRTRWDAAKKVVIR